jgi:hypothetical protein
MNRFYLVTLLASAGFSLIGFSQTYRTRFEGTEDPLSEGGRWTNNGVDWTRITKKDGIACGTQTGTNTGIHKFNDSYAHLSGFSADQEAWGQARIAKPNSPCIQELEILLRFTSIPHRTTGYECFARCVNSASSYVQIVRWDGPLGKFTYLADKRGANYGLNNGDILKASIVGNLITVSINGIEKARITDDTFKTGNPGIGEYLACETGQGIGSNSDFGFSSYTARGLGASSRAGNAQVRLTILDSDTESPVPCRIHLKDATGNPVRPQELPFWYDTPVWLASGMVDSVGIAHNHMQRGGVMPNEAWGRARDEQRLPDPEGNELWTQEIYYHILNSGLRLPPSDFGFRISFPATALSVCSPPAFRRLGLQRRIPAQGGGCRLLGRVF